MIWKRGWAVSAHEHGSRVQSIECACCRKAMSEVGFGDQKSHWSGKNRSWVWRLWPLSHPDTSWPETFVSKLHIYRIFQKPAKRKPPDSEGVVTDVSNAPRRGWTLRGVGNPARVWKNLLQGCRRASKCVNIHVSCHRRKETDLVPHMFVTWRDLFVMTFQQECDIQESCFYAKKKNCEATIGSTHCLCAFPDRSDTHQASLNYIYI